MMDNASRHRPPPHSRLPGLQQRQRSAAGRDCRARWRWARGGLNEIWGFAASRPAELGVDSCWAGLVEGLKWTVAAGVGVEEGGGQSIQAAQA